MKHLLDNIVWHALTGPQARFSAGGDEARRYARGFSPILGFADQARPNFAALTALCETGEHFYTDRWSGAAPGGRHIDVHETPFLHVLSSNVGARQLYERMGFRNVRESVIRVISRD